MKIILNDTFKSLRAFVSDDLSEMSIITGRNGSGKSQLLNLINGKSKNDPKFAGIRLELGTLINKYSI